jgi:hypothetical protein
VAETIDRHREHLVGSGRLEEQRQVRRVRNLQSALHGLATQRVDHLLEGDRGAAVSEVIGAVGRGETDPLLGARKILRTAFGWREN